MSFDGVLDTPLAVEALLLAWREHRHPDFSALIRQLTPVEKRRAPSGKEAFHDHWLGVARAASTPDMEWLGSTLFSRVPQPEVSVWDESFVKVRFGPLFARVRALRELPADPRVGHHLLAGLARKRFSTGYDSADAKTLFRPMFELLVHHGDQGLAEGLTGQAENPTATTGGQRDAFRTLARHSLQRLPAAGEPDSSELAAVRSRLKIQRDSQEVQPLIEAIRLDPGDLGLRAVLADVLQEAGDPRGTFIALQLAGDEASLRKAAGLFRKHRLEWLGPLLSRVLQSPRFKNGFLYCADVGPNPSADEAEWQRAAMDPRLATLEELYLGKSNQRNYQLFATSPALTHLTTVVLPSKRVLEAVLEGPTARTLTTLHLSFGPSPAQVEAIAALPLLKRMDVRCTAKQLPALAKTLKRAGLRERIQLKVFGPKSELLAEHLGE